MHAQNPETERTDGLIDILWNQTSYLEIDQKRFDAMVEMQKYADQCSDTLYKDYYESDDAQECARNESAGILRFYKKAIDKVVNEVANQDVPEGTVRLWQLYNMGYVVKTATDCFGIDIKHKYGELLAPYLKFLLITHNHSDHNTALLKEAMAKSGKPVYSNFMDNGYKIKGKEKIVIGDIEIETDIVDHNNTLRNFVVTYQIDCGKKANNCVILHTGDACNVAQINPTKQVNIFIPHLAVGLDMFKTVEKVNPEIVLMSHILELGHAVDKWRWSYEYGVDRCKELNRDKVYLSVWGESVIYK